MSDALKPLWGEGLFLRPQHFQNQDAYHEALLHIKINALNPYAFGIRSIAIDENALTDGVLRITELSAIFPDGTFYDAPQADNLPDEVVLTSASKESLHYYIGLIPLKNFGRNLPREDEPSTAMRYAKKSYQHADQMTESPPTDIDVVRKNAYLIQTDVQPHNYVSLPLLRISPAGSGKGYIPDTKFIPPSISLHASPALDQVLVRLLDALEAKIHALYGLHREPSKNIIEFRSGDIASFWLLHTASTAHAALSHLRHQLGFHPERLFQEMLRLAGGLATFAKYDEGAALPIYNHLDLTTCFTQLENILRKQLEVVISTRYLLIPLHEHKASYFTGQLDSDKIDADTRLYLSVSANMPAVDLISVVPIRFKLGSPDDVETLVLSALSGIPLVHMPQAPAEIPVRPGVQYFSIEPRGALYERVMKGKVLVIYVPNGIENLKLELIAVTK